MEINWLEWLGYAASVIVAISLIMSSIIKLRWINLVGSILFTVYGFMIGALPVGLVNLLISFINIYYLISIYSHKEYFKIVPANATDAMYTEFYKHNALDIQKTQPEMNLERTLNSQIYFILRNMKVAGIVVFEKVGNQLNIILDYVTPEFRDFKQGNYIFNNSDLFQNIDFEEFKTQSSNSMHKNYLKKIGFAEKTVNGKTIFTKKRN